MDNSLSKKLVLTVKNARLTRDTSVIGKMDPYVILNVNGKAYKTKVHNNGGKHPEWNERFEIEYTNDHDAIEVKVYDDDVGDDDPIGNCALWVTQLNN
jgi:Ca2+-dependent lipid-binding protein